MVRNSTGEQKYKCCTDVVKGYRAGKVVLG
jgi:hypothetical protein